MHRDETRDPKQHEKELLADLLSDGEALLTRYRGLLARDRRQREELRTIRAELDQLRTRAAQANDLSARLGSASSALEAYRAESRRLKADLKRLRGSKALRLSRAASAPGRWVRARTAAAHAGPSGSAEAVAAPVSRHASEKESSSATEREAVLVKRASELTYAELQQRLHLRPTPGNLYLAVNRAWFGHGLIGEPSSMIDDHAELVDELEPQQRAIIERVLGARRAWRAADLIPGRAPGVAYVAERERLLYCVHSTPVYHSNGYSTRTRGVTAALKAQGLDVRVMARAGYPWDTAADRKLPARRRSVSTDHGTEYVHVPGPHEHRDPEDRAILQMADAIVREARLYRPSMIQAASNYRTGLAALIAARRLGLPFVYEVRGLWEVTEASVREGFERSDRYALARELETLVCQEADHVLAITREVADDLASRGIDSERISLLPNGVDPDRFSPVYEDAQMRARLRPHPSGRNDLPVIGFAGSLVHYEGLDLLLRASAQLHDRGVLHHVVIAGSGPAEPELRALTEEAGLAHVTFLGRMKPDAVPRLMSIVDIVACPRLSTPVTEMVSPLKPLEAMSAGCAVVMSRLSPHLAIGGEDGRRAVLHDPGDPAALAESLQPLLVDPDSRRAIGRRGRRWVLAERRWAHLGAVAVAAHRRAAQAHLEATTDGVPLTELRVAVVSDEFTRKTLQAEVNCLSLSRDNWRQQVSEFDPHLVLIESAWANHDEWNRGVGYYSDEEHKDFRDLVAFARQRGIPTAFWNKEDPVHFERFAPAAAQCDHVFTTDANKIPDYLERAVHTRTASAMPFFAAPTLHNPLPGSMTYQGGSSYAGTYYGERYPQRSAELSRLLKAAVPFGLTIYDRQADNPESPYRFPPALQRYVAGSLPYDQVLNAYKAFAANLNVNSVRDSPSMFSRRVVEAAASAGVVMSAGGRGIPETFGSAIASSSDSKDWQAWLRSWTSDPAARLAEAWLQMRAVLRAHTAGTALTIMARTAGVPVVAPSLPTYVAILAEASDEIVDAVARQSVSPRLVVCPADAVDRVRARMPVPVVSAETYVAEGDYELAVTALLDRTAAEDLLHATRWAAFDWVAVDNTGESAPPYAVPEADCPKGSVVLRSPVDVAHGGLLLKRPEHADNLPESTSAVSAFGPDLTGRKILVAGHDLKFAVPVIAALRELGAIVTTDVWDSHSQHDEATSRRLLVDADVVWCEWGLGNAVWYSHNIAEDQRLVVRVHAQELRRPYLRQIDHGAVDSYLFVGRTPLESAVLSHGVPAQKAAVVPNLVDVDNLALPKHPEAEHTLGFVGAVPQSKRLDLCLDLLERLRLLDDRYRLRIKGHQPDGYPWLANYPGAAEYYANQLRRIARLNETLPGVVVWDEHGDDMAEWYRRVGVAVSVSDHESFHFTVADGAASGALPAVLAWPGAEHLYPAEWLATDLDGLVARIMHADRDPAAWTAEVRERYAPEVVLPQLLGQLAGALAGTPGAG